MRRQDKAKNMKRANMLFEQRCNEAIPLTHVGGQEGDATPKHAPKKHIPLKHVGGKEGDAPAKKRLPLKQKVREFDNAEMQGQEDFYNQMNQNDKLEGTRVANNGNDSDAIVVSGYEKFYKPGGTVYFEHPYDFVGTVVKDDGNFIYLKKDKKVIKIPKTYLDSNHWKQI